jgi:TonB-linked SusC/RagA family outer membrane protein
MQMRKITLLFVMYLLTTTLIFAQVQNVTGKVTDATGSPVPFVTVTVKGTRTAVSANENGVYSIKAKPGDVLIISGVGLQNQETKVTGTDMMTVSVQRVNNNLAEVVVTALGIQKQAKELGYSATTVQAKDLIVAKPVSVVNGLTGKVSGLQINNVNNGLFAPSRVTLRGNRSLTGNNQPLLVVDGAIYYNDISTINPDDIVDINVLKGSSASAVYGSDASNGVLIVTTKKGARGKTSVNFTSTVQFESLSYMLALQNEFGSNGGEAFVYDFNDLSTYIPYENQSYGPRFNGKMVPIGRPVADGSVLMVPYSPVKNGKRNFFNTGLTTQNAVSYQSGDENSRFMMSLQDVNQKAIMPGDYGRRDAFRVGGSKTYGIFSASYTMAYTYLYKNTTNTGTVYQMVMNTPAHVPLTSLKDWRNNKFADINGFYNDYFDNPYWDIDNMRNKTTDNNLSGNVQFGLKPVKWLNLTYRLGLTSLNSRYEYTQSPRVYSAYAKTDKRVFYSNPAGTGIDTVLESPKWIASNGDVAASYTTSNYSNFLWTSDFVASLDKGLNKDFNLKASLGTTFMENSITGIYINAPALVIPVYNINNVQGTPNLGTSNSGLSNSNYNREARKLGFFGEATLGYRNYAFLHGSYRTDIDSRLSKDNRFIPYYDVDGSLVLSDLFPSIVSNKGLSYAKVRAAYSVTGNASPLGSGSPYIAQGAYVINPTYNVAGGFPFGSLGGYNLNTTVANPNIKPEKVNEYEVGLELGFLNRFNLVLAAYQSELTDGIVKASISSATGYYSALVNAAHTKNKGFEAELKASLVKSKNVLWSVNLNYTHNESKVVSINGGVKSLGISGNIIDGSNANAYAVVDQPYPVIETRDWNRDPQGRVIVDPVTGNPSRNPNLIVAGQATPKDVIGLSSNLTWKNFTFTVTMDYRGGHKIFNSIGQYIDFTGISATSASTHRQRFVFPNSSYLDGTGKYVQNTSVMVDDANFNFWPGLYRSVGTNYITSAAAWKLREVAIAYQIPRKVFAATKIVQAATFTVSGRNLLMLRPKSNVWTDPEFSDGTGNDVGRTTENQAPPTRIFSATLSVTF